MARFEDGTEVWRDLEDESGPFARLWPHGLGGFLEVRGEDSLIVAATISALQRQDRTLALRNLRFWRHTDPPLLFGGGVAGLLADLLQSAGLPLVEIAALYNVTEG